MSETNPSREESTEASTTFAGEAPIRRRWRVSTIVALTIVISVLSTIGIAAAAGDSFRARGAGPEAGVVRCPGGMSRLGHIFDENASIFPGDPAVDIEIIANIPELGYLVELVTTGTHTGTHLDAPGHFIDGARTIDQLDAEEFVWPAYVIDVRDRMAAEGPDFQLTRADIRAYEQENGHIRRGTMVIIQTGFETKYGTPGYVEDPYPGFGAEAVQWLFDNRNIAGLGSDTLGPDAKSDELFDTTYTALLNDGVTLPGLTNLDSLSTKGDVIMAPAIALRDGSGYQVDPLACHAGMPG